MKKIIFFLLLLSILTVGCEKVIKLSVDKSEPKLVIEGTLTNRSKECFVYISTTQPVDEWNKFDGLSYAKVAITNSSGKTDSLKEIEKGIYYNANLKGAPGETYSLSVMIDKELYTASANMPKTSVKPDSIYTKYEDVYQNYTTSIYFNDPIDEQNYYLFYLYKNKRKYNSFFTQDDEFYNGKTVKQDLFVFSNEEQDKLHAGDTVSVQMLQIEKPVYTYFYSLNAGALGGTGGPGSFGSPANPVSNFKGKEVLGYFSAHILHNISTIIKK